MACMRFAHVKPQNCALYSVCGAGHARFTVDEATREMPMTATSACPAHASFDPFDPAYLAEVLGG